MNEPYPPKRRRPRIHHDPSLAKRYPWELIERHQGREALLNLNRFRWLLNGQVAALLFYDQPGPNGQPITDATARDKCNKKCLLRLKDAGLIERIPIFYTHPVTGSTVRDGVNLLTAVGAELVESWLVEAEQGDAFRWHPGLKQWSEAEIRHELAVNDFAIALHRAVWARGWEVIGWHDDDQLRTLARGTALGGLIPDGMCVIESDAKRLPLFLELDRGTEPVTGRSSNRWSSKVERYLAYFQRDFSSDPFFLTYLGYEAGQLTMPVVAGVTTKGELRLKNLSAASQDVGGSGHIWHTTTRRLYPVPPDEREQRILRKNAQTAPNAAAIQRAFQLRRRDAFWQPIWLTGEEPDDRTGRALTELLTVGLPLTTPPLLESGLTEEGM